jgi:hypothetical protein
MFRGPRITAAYRCVLQGEGLGGAGHRYICIVSSTAGREGIGTAPLSVHYYPRNTGKHQLLNSLPYVVVSRRSEELVDRLAEGRPSHSLRRPAQLLPPRRFPVAWPQADRACPQRGARLLRCPGQSRGQHLPPHVLLNEARKLAQRFEPVLSEADHVLAISPRTKPISLRTSSM